MIGQLIILVSILFLTITLLSDNNMLLLVIPGLPHALRNRFSICWTAGLVTLDVGVVVCS